MSTARSCFDLFRFSVAWYGLLILAVLLVNSDTAKAQNTSESRAIYGRGVHAFFAGQSPNAEQYFTQAIQSGSTDPRTYYFRAMARLRMGRSYEAENDMRIGASLEASNPGSQHAIGRALQRVQGPGRRTLEKFRREARLNRVQQRHSQAQARYEQLRRREQVVLHRKTPVLLDKLVAPSSREQSAATDRPAAPVVVDDAQTSAVQAPTEPMPAENATDFLGPRSEVESPEQDLFGDPLLDMPSKQSESAQPAETPDEDLFGDTPSDKDLSEDLFGEDVPSESSDDEMIAEPESTENASDSLTVDATSARPANLDTPSPMAGVVSPKEVFFRLGLMLGSLGNRSASPPVAPPAVDGGEFEFGPAETVETAPASTEVSMPAEDSSPAEDSADDLFGEPSSEAEPDDPFETNTTRDDAPAANPSDNKSDETSAAPEASEEKPADPFEDDPFGGI